MEEVRDFNGDLRIGKQAEKWVLDNFGGRDGFNDILLNAEVKASLRNGYIFIEEWSDTERGIKGWLYKLNDNQPVMFINVDQNIGVVIVVKHLKERFEEIKENYKITLKESERNGRIWKSEGRAIRADEFDRVYLIPAMKGKGL
jgi:hypothetical protein